MRGRRSDDGVELRRAGVIVTAVLVVSVAAAIFVARFYHTGVPATVITLLGLAPPALVVGWLQFLQGRRPQTPVPTDEAIVAEFQRVGEIFRAKTLDQWNREFRIRKFNDRGELLVSWSGDPDVMVSWDDLLKAARSEGGGLPDEANRWALSPAGLSGSEEDLPDVLKRVPTGWLVVLGGPGSGKSMLMVRLILKLLNQWTPGKPVPVLVSITSWNPAPEQEGGQDLFSWLEDRLRITYPVLDVPMATVEGAPSRVRALMSSRMIAPILDGLDEMPPAARQSVIGRLNDALTDRMRPQYLVVTCREDEYRQLVGRTRQVSRGRKPSWFPLDGAAAIALHPLGTAQVKAYLSDKGNDQRWQPVEADLDRSGTPVEKALQTPLAVSLAAAIYNRQRDESPDNVPDPAELCKKGKFRTGHAVLSHLLARFVPAVYRSESKGVQAAATRRLIFLAQYLTYRRGGMSTKRRSAAARSGDAPRRAARARSMLGKLVPAGRGADHTGNTGILQWWDIEDAAPPGLVPLAVGTACGIISGIAAGLGSRVGVGIGVGFGTGMLVALAIGLFVRRRVTLRLEGGRVARTLEWATAFAGRPGPGISGALTGAAIGSLAAGIAGKHGIGYSASLVSGLPEGLGIGIGAGASTTFGGGIAAGLAGGFAGGLLEGFGLGLPAALVNGLGVGMAAGLAVFYMSQREPAHHRPAWGPIGLAGGGVIGAVVGLIMWREIGVVAGLVGALLTGAAAAWPLGLRDTREEDLAKLPTPRDALARDVRAFRLTALAAGLAAGVVGFTGGSLSSVFEVHEKPHLLTVLGDGIGIGLASGLVIGLTFGFYHAASPNFLVVTWWLALTKGMPWRLMRFLDDAHQRSVLRQIGVEYEFRHKSVREYLADAGPEPNVRGPLQKRRDAGRSRSAMPRG